MGQAANEPENADYNLEQNKKKTKKIVCVLLKNSNTQVNFLILITETRGESLEKTF